MSHLELLKSSKAIVTYRQVHGEMGGATIWCIVLADGFIVDCGSDGLALGRATLLAEAVNKFGPDQFKEVGMRCAHLNALEEKP